jgi:hypothetical protein
LLAYLKDSLGCVCVCAVVKEATRRTASVSLVLTGLARCVYLPPLPSALDRLLPAARSWLRVYDDEGPQHPHGTHKCIFKNLRSPAIIISSNSNKLPSAVFCPHTPVLRESNLDADSSECVCVYTLTRNQHRRMKFIDQNPAPSGTWSWATAMFFSLL